MATTRITGKQRSARKRNIKIAQSAKKKGGGARGKAGKAFKKAYKQARKEQKFLQGGKSTRSNKMHARRAGHKAAMKAAPKAGSKLASTFAKGRATIGYGGKRMKQSKTAKLQFARGYTRALRTSNY